MLFGLFEDNKVVQKVQEAVEHWHSFDDKSLKEQRITEIFTAMGWQQNAWWDFLGLDTSCKTGKIKFAIKQVLDKKKMDAFPLIPALSFSQSGSIQQSFPFFKRNEVAMIHQAGVIFPDDYQGLSWEQTKSVLCNQARSQAASIFQPLLRLSKKDLIAVEWYLRGMLGAPSERILHQILRAVLALRISPQLALTLPRRHQQFFSAIASLPCIDKMIEKLIQKTFRSQSGKEISCLGSTLTKELHQFQRDNPTATEHPSVERDSPRGAQKKIHVGKSETIPATDVSKLTERIAEMSAAKKNPQQFCLMLQNMMTQDAYGLQLGHLKMVFQQTPFLALSNAQSEPLDITITDQPGGAEVEYSYRATVTDYTRSSEHEQEHVAGEVCYSFKLQLKYNPRSNTYSITGPGDALPTFTRQITLTPDADGFTVVNL